MHDRVEHSAAYDWAGHLKSRSDERGYRNLVWQSDTKTLERIAWIAGTVLLVSFAIDYFFVEATSETLILNFMLRAVCSTLVFAFALKIRNTSYKPALERLAFSTELVVVICYLGLVGLMRDIVVAQSAMLLAITIFLWFYVPIHARFALVSTVVLGIGQLGLNLTVSPQPPAELAMSYVLLFAVAGMGFLSKRSRECLRRENYLHEQRLSSSNEALRREVETRSRAEEREAGARERFELLFRVSPMPLALTEHEGGTLLQANNALLDLIGEKEKAVIGRRARSFMVPNTGYDQLSQSLGNSRDVVTGEFKVETSGNGVRECVATSVRLELEGREVVLTGLMDITHRKEFERELIAAKNTAESAQKAQSEFLATMSHEMRTPLNALLGFLQIIELEEPSEGTKQNLALARHSGEHLLQLISDVLDLSKLAAGRIEISRTNTDCDELSRRAVDTFKIAAADRGLELTYRSNVAHTQYRVDDIRVRQVLLNLVGNAVKFTSQGSVDVSLTEDGTGDVPQLRFEVRDTGIGLPPEKHQEIFDDFSQADRSITRSYGGSGLGLAISKKLVEAMNGEIGVKSDVGIGSTFWFTFPAEPVNTPASATRAAS